MSKWDSVLSFLRSIEEPSVLRVLDLANDPNGFVREEAVRQLGWLGDVTALDCLLERANDWVPQVRAAALVALRRLMVPANAAAFVRSLPAVFHLAHCQRASHQALIEEISNFLALPENRAVLRLGLEADDPRVRRLCYDVTLTHQVEPVSETICRALRDDDVLVQGKAAARLAGLEGERAAEVLAQALRSPTAAVREAALRLHLNQPTTAPLVTTVRRHALDRSGSVRAIAFRWLEEQGVDVTALLLEAIRQADRSNRERRAGMLGIAEMRRADLLPEILPHLTSEWPSIRGAALAATARLDPDRAPQLCEQALSDPSPGVVRLASRLLMKLGVQFDSQRLSELVRTDDRVVARRVAAALSRHSNKWERLLFLLRMAVPLDPVINLGDELLDWHREFNRSAAEPTSEQLRELGLLVRRSERFIPSRMKADLSFTLRQLEVR